MRTQISRLSALFMVLLLLPVPDWATCGGGGGGGMGGMRSGGAPGSPGMGSEQVYQVPWKILKPEEALTPGGLVVYWFPSSVQEFQKSSLRNSRSLSLYATECVTMGVAEASSTLGQKFVGADKLPVVVLAKTDGTVINKLQNNNGFLKVDQVEKLVESEMKQREETVKNELKAAKEKAKSGDKDGAIPLYKSVLDEKCLFPGKAKDAAKELKKLGVDVTVKLFDAPVMNPAQSAKIEAVMKRGLDAEMNDKYEEAERLYSEARRMDPADPAPLRYLGELYRHHLGEWDKARVTFQAILDMPADPLSRAVALHGLGKMTIHEGDFLAGLHLMEDFGARISPRAGVPQFGGLLELGRRHRQSGLLHARSYEARSNRSVQYRVRRCLSCRKRSWRRSVENRARKRSDAACLLQPCSHLRAARPKAKGTRPAQAAFL